MSTPEEQAAIDRGDVVEEEEEILEEEEVLEAEEDEPGEVVEEEEEITIPKARFDESRKAAKAEAEALKARISELEGAVKKDEAPTVEVLETEIETLEDEHEALLLEGEIDKAKAVRRDMNAKRNALIDRRISEKSSAMGQAAVQQVRYDTQLANFEAKYPAMNPDAVEFDAQVSDEVGTLMNAFQASGMPLVGALNKAVHYVFRDDAPKESSNNNNVREERKTAARQKALDTVNKSPADLKDIGRNSDKAGRDDGLPNPLKMSQKQFDEMSEKQKSELRGDTLQ